MARFRRRLPAAISWSGRPVRSRFPKSASESSRTFVAIGRSGFRSRGEKEAYNQNREGAALVLSPS